jgi:hypothetical protein
MHILDSRKRWRIAAHIVLALLIPLDQISQPNRINAGRGVPLNLNLKIQRATVVSQVRPLRCGERWILAASIAPMSGQGLRRCSGVAISEGLGRLADRKILHLIAERSRMNLSYQAN